MQQRRQLVVTLQFRRSTWWQCCTAVGAAEAPVSSEEAVEAEAEAEAEEAGGGAAASKDSV